MGGRGYQHRGPPPCRFRGDGGLFRLAQPLPLPLESPTNSRRYILGRGRGRRLLERDGVSAAGDGAA